MFATPALNLGMRIADRGLETLSPIRHKFSSVVQNLESEIHTRPAVSCRSVTKEFGANGTKTFALRGVDLDINDGQLTLLVGPSGCGKTTLISLVAGLLNPTQGEVVVLGNDLSKMSGRQLVDFRAKKIG